MYAIDRVMSRRFLGVLALMLVAVVLSGCAAHGVGGTAASDLVPQPPTHPTLFERASATRAAIHGADFGQATQLIAAEYSASRIERWGFRPFAIFMGYVAAPADATFVNELNAWVAQDPSSPTAYLVRAAYLRNVAWQARGNGFAASLTSAQAQAFSKDMAQAAQDIQTSLQLDPRDPYAWYQDVSIQRDAGGGNAAQQAAFAQAIKQFPNYYPLYSVRLAALQPKWFGSVAAMQQFVQRYAGGTPADSPLRVLYVELYGHLLVAARMNCYAQAGAAYNQCLAATMTQIAPPAIVHATLAAVTQAMQGGKPDALNEVGQQIIWMLTLKDSGQFGLPLLDAAATALHTDVQLTANDTQHNNWMLDHATAEFWDVQPADQSAIALDLRALKDLPNTHFASVNQEDAARAVIYEDLTVIYDGRNDFNHELAYGRAAATLLGGFGAAAKSDSDVCYALFRLHRYREGLRTCSAIVDANQDPNARFYRARIHEAMGESAAAVTDYTSVADSTANLGTRQYAAIEVSNLQADRHAYGDALATLDHYAYLFPSAQTDAYDEASYYNDRCYNEMYLNKLDAALQDCNTSIDFKPLPDAIKKRALILQRQASVKPAPAPALSV